MNCRTYLKNLNHVERAPTSLIKMTLEEISKTFDWLVWSSLPSRFFLFNDAGYLIALVMITKTFNRYLFKISFLLQLVLVL